MALYYLDASALVKLVAAEPESAALREFVADEELVSCELVLTEVPRAIRRFAGKDTRQCGRLIGRAGELLEVIPLLPVDDALLAAAGALDEPGLRTLDAIHLAAALGVIPLDAFVGYDERQNSAARLAGFRVVAPGAGQ